MSGSDLDPFSISPTFAESTPVISCNLPCSVQPMLANSRIMVWRVTAPVIAIGSELLQLVGLLPGTFDVFDLCVLVIASIFGIIISLL